MAEETEETPKRTRRKKAAPLPEGTITYAGTLAAQVAALVNVQSSAELREKVAPLAEAIDGLEGRTNFDGGEALLARIAELGDGLSDAKAERDALQMQLDGIRPGALEQERAELLSRVASLEVELGRVADQAAEHATVRAALEQELDLARRDLEQHLGLGDEGDRLDEAAAIDQLERLGWTRRTSSRGRYELALIKGGDGKDYGAAMGVRILELEAQVVDLLAVELEVISALRRGGVLRDDETPTTPELVALMKRLRATTEGT